MSLFHLFTEMFNNQEDVPVQTTTTTTVCKHISNNGDCNLIQKLKELQAKKRDVDSKITLYSNNSDVNLATFIELLADMETYGFEMRREYRSYYNTGHSNSWIKYTFSDRYGVGRFEQIIEKITDEDIDKIHEELKSFKHRASILSELQQQSSELDTEIKASRLFHAVFPFPFFVLLLGGFLGQRPPAYGPLRPWCRRPPVDAPRVGGRR